MKANPLAYALLVLLAVAVQLPAKQPTTNAAEQKISPSGTNAATVPDFATLNSWEDFQIVEARQRYEEDARTNHITLDKPQYNNAPWSEIRLSTSALKGDGLAASLCYGSNALQRLFWVSLAATNGWIPSQVRLARDFEYERPKERERPTPTNIFTFDKYTMINREVEEIVKQPKAARLAAAQFWWSKAKAGLPKLKDDAARNDARATYALGLLHESGDLVESNAVFAAEMFHMAAKSGLAPAQESWGEYCNWHLTNRVEAAGWYYRAATQGLMSAQASLSVLHRKPTPWNFNPHFQPKACEMARWTFERASKQDRLACSELGELYFNGLGVQSNAVEAVKWFRKAAEQNWAEAQNILGICYCTGCGVVKDYAEAVKWFRKAAEQNNADAQKNLGFLAAELANRIAKTPTPARQSKSTSSEWQPPEGDEIIKGTNIPRWDDTTPLSTKTPISFVLPDEIKTRNGKVYQGVKLLAKTDFEIKILNFDREGAMQIDNIKLADLPEELQKQFGYDPKKAVVEEARQKEREKLFAAPKPTPSEQRWTDYNSTIERMNDQQAKADAAAAAAKQKWEEELKEREIEAKERAAAAAEYQATHPPIIIIQQQQQQQQQQGH